MQHAVPTLVRLVGLAIMMAGNPNFVSAAPPREDYQLPDYTPRAMNTDPWEMWSTRPDGSGSIQDLLLVQGRLRHTVSQNDMAAFKAVLSSMGCDGSAPGDAKCEALLHHGDPNGRTIYHVIGKLGLGGDYVQATSSLISAESAKEQGILDPDNWRLSAEWPNDVMSYSLLKQIYEYSRDVLKIPPNLKLRDISGQTPLHEASLHGHVLTVRAMVLITGRRIFEPDPTVLSDRYFDPVAGYIADFVRAEPLRREWAFGWTMMNFAATTARDSALIRIVQSAMTLAMESEANFAVSRGMTVMDYAAINGHADVVDLLAYLENNRVCSSDSKKVCQGDADCGDNSVCLQTKGLTGLGFAASNWGEVPIQKAITLGHEAVVERFLQYYGCARVFSPRSEGGETIFHNAVGGGQAAILEFLKTQCRTQYNIRMSLPAKLDSSKYIWSEQTPCQMSQVMLDYINKHEIGDRENPEFPEGFVGAPVPRCPLA